MNTGRALDRRILAAAGLQRPDFGHRDTNSGQHRSAGFADLETRGKHQPDAHATMRGSWSRSLRHRRSTTLRYRSDQGSVPSLRAGYGVVLEFATFLSCRFCRIVRRACSVIFSRSSRMHCRDVPCRRGSVGFLIGISRLVLADLSAAIRRPANIPERSARTALSRAVAAALCGVTPFGSAAGPVAFNAAIRLPAAATVKPGRPA